MSVILDALRRSRRVATSGSATGHDAPHVPAGLGLGRASSSPASASRTTRPRFLAIGLLLVIGLGAWAAYQVSQSLMTNDAAPAQPSRASGAARGSSPAPQPPAANQSPGLTPSQSPQPTSPTVVLRSAPEAEQGARTNDTTKQFELAVRYQNLGDYDAALKQYRAVLAADRFNVAAYNNLGVLYHRRGLRMEAIEQFRRAIAINADYVTARSNLGVVLMEAGRLAEARAELRAAMALEPRSADVIVNLALVEHADRHRDEAIELLLRAIGYQPTHAMAHYNVAVLYDEQSALALAYEHYTDFLKHGGPEQGELLAAVQRRVSMLKPKLPNAP